jgi:hypothetical protein
MTGAAGIIPIPCAVMFCVCVCVREREREREERERTATNKIIPVHALSRHDFSGREKLPGH